MDVFKVKTCSRCGCEKELPEFPKNKSKKDGHDSRCKRCNVACSLIYAANNKAKICEYKKKYRSQNKSKTGLATAEWRKLNPERVRARKRAAVERLSDGYLGFLLGMKSAECPVEILEAKRFQVQLHRLTKELTEALNEATKGEEK